MKKIQLQASSLNILVTIVLFLVAGTIIGGFYYSQNWLNNLATTNNVSPSGPTTGSSGAIDLSKLQIDITNQKVASEKAIAMVVSRSDYQSLVQQDIRKYESETGVKVKDFSAAQQPTTTSTKPLLSGIQPGFIKITLLNPVTYTNLIKFIKAIETNIPKIKITGISLSRADGNSSSINVEPIILEVYTR